MHVLWKKWYNFVLVLFWPQELKPATKKLGSGLQNSQLHEDWSDLFAACTTAMNIQWNLNVISHCNITLLLEPTPINIVTIVRDTNFNCMLSKCEKLINCCCILGTYLVTISYAFNSNKLLHCTLIGIIAMPGFFYFVDLHAFTRRRDSWT